MKHDFAKALKEMEGWLPTDLFSDEILEATIAALKAAIWRPMNTAPKGEKLFLLRKKGTPVVVEAAFFHEYPDYADGQPYGEPFWDLRDLTNDEPVTDWADTEDGGSTKYEWQEFPLPDKKIPGA